MEWQLPESERTYLRELAKKQAEYAALPVMEQRKQMWYALNDGKPGARAPVVIETGTFNRDFMPEGILHCQSEIGRRLEWQLLCNVRNHELIDDDKVIPDYFEIRWFTEIDEFGFSIGHESVKDSQGINTGYRFLHPIENLKEDLSKLKPAICKVDREKTFAWKAFLEELFDGIMPVEIHTVMHCSTMLTHRVIELIGMEVFCMAMYDTPDALHTLMTFLRDNALRIMHWMEAENLLRLNNGNQESFGSSYNFTTKLPAPGYNPEEVRLCDMWSHSNSQETIGVSPAMFHDFCFPYYAAICEPVGLLYYGCCEPAHPFWEDISKLPHLKKISISPWCDQDFMGEALQGTEIVFSRKPSPNYLSVDVQLDEAGWRAHVRESIKATRGAAMEFILRDIYTVHGNLENARRAVAIAREEIDQSY